MTVKTYFEISKKYLPNSWWRIWFGITNFDHAVLSLSRRAARVNLRLASAVGVVLFALLLPLGLLAALGLGGWQVLSLVTWLPEPFTDWLALSGVEGLSLALSGWPILLGAGMVRGRGHVALDTLTDFLQIQPPYKREDTTYYAQEERDFTLGGIFLGGGRWPVFEGVYRALVNRWGPLVGFGIAPVVLESVPLVGLLGLYHWLGGISTALSPPVLAALAFWYAFHVVPPAFLQHLRHLRGWAALRNLAWRELLQPAQLAIVGLTLLGLVGIESFHLRSAFVGRLLADFLLPHLVVNAVTEAIRHLINLRNSAHLTRLHHLRFSHDTLVRLREQWLTETFVITAPEMERLMASVGGFSPLALRTLNEIAATNHALAAILLSGLRSYDVPASWQAWVKTLPESALVGPLARQLQEPIRLTEESGNSERVFLAELMRQAGLHPEDETERVRVLDLLATHRVEAEGEWPYLFVIVSAQSGFSSSLPAYLFSSEKGRAWLRRLAQRLTHSHSITLLLALVPVSLLLAGGGLTHGMATVFLAGLTVSGLQERPASSEDRNSVSWTWLEREEGAGAGGVQGQPDAVEQPSRGQEGPHQSWPASPRSEGMGRCAWRRAAGKRPWPRPRSFQRHFQGQCHGSGPPRAARRARWAATKQESTSRGPRCQRWRCAVRSTLWGVETAPERTGGRGTAGGGGPQDPAPAGSQG
jgi:hypothetical protein